MSFDCVLKKKSPKNIQTRSDSECLQGENLPDVPWPTGSMLNFFFTNLFFKQIIHAPPEVREVYKTINTIPKI